MSSQHKLAFETLNTTKLAEEIKQRAREARNEEELRIGFAIVFDPILRALKIKPAYERHTAGIRCIVSGLRKDALYGSVILEFKSPGKLKNKREFDKAKEQVRKYIKAEGIDPRSYGRYYGILTDGLQIGFVRFRKEIWEESAEPLELSAQTVLRLLEAMRGLKRKPIEAQLLLEDFGPESKISEKVIVFLYKALVHSKSARTKMLFEDWKRVFSQVCSYSKKKFAGLVDHYGLKDYKIVDFEKLMFAIHTYYTILMKLLTSEIVTLFADGLIGSYLRRLDDAYLRSKEDMQNEMRELEEGGIFVDLGIRNFLEADYFAWYLDEWDKEIAYLIDEIAKKLLDYEPATVKLTPERVKDLFKILYQNLVSKDIRHKIGEYFTPDWLAELLLDEIGFDGDPEKRVLDPACGSGTFLILAINRIREYAEEHFVDKRTLLTKIARNVQGIDLNPLAVLASKANYIIALADLLRYRPKEGIEIPVYLADSIAVGRRVKVTGESEVYMKTIEGEFWIPHEVMEKELLSGILDDIELCIRNKYSKRIFKEFAQKRYELKESSIESLVRLYWKLVSLERKGRNKIWTKILKNSFAPLLMGKFDYVVGNPPWINWENLPEFYRNETKGLWNWYGLFKKTRSGGLGKVKKDVAMLFVARSLDRFTKYCGKLAFLLPFTVYKTRAGAGFRAFLDKGKVADPRIPCKVQRVHDLVTLYPFEAAVNRTSLIVIEKRGKTEFPIPCVMWHNPRTKGINEEAELEEVKRTTKQFDMILVPLRKGKPETPWMIINEKAHNILQKVMKPSQYKAHAGVCTWADGIFWVEILSKQPSGILVSNVGKTAKMTTKRIKNLVDPEFVFPVLRGKNHKKWYTRCEGHIVLPVSSSGKILSERELKVNHPNTYSYFFSFSEELRNRSGYKLMFKKSGKPFYSVLRAKYGIKPYKVSWKHIAGKISGKALFECSVIIEEKGKPVIPTHGVMIISCDNEDEAYYVCAILNSSFSSLVVASYALEVHVPTDVPKHVYVPDFNPKNRLHQKLAKLSKKAHTTAKQIFEENREDLKKNLKRIEAEIDDMVAQLYRVSNDELKEIKKCLRILKEGEIEEEKEPKKRQQGLKKR